MRKPHQARAERTMRNILAASGSAAGDAGLAAPRARAGRAHRTEGVRGGADAGGVFADRARPHAVRPAQVDVRLGVHAPEISGGAAGGRGGAGVRGIAPVRGHAFRHGQEGLSSLVSNIGS